MPHTVPYLDNQSLALNVVGNYDFRNIPNYDRIILWVTDGVEAGRQQPRSTVAFDDLIMDAKQAISAAQTAAEGDSNDEEIAVLQSTIESLTNLINALGVQL